MLKCDLHMHSMEDPNDVLGHTAYELIDHAAKLGYQVLALTLHGRLYFPPELKEYASSKDILLIPGIEIYLDKREVLILGQACEAIQRLKTLEQLREIKKDYGDDLLVIAPHPFYGAGQCVGDKFLQCPELFDALEFCHFYNSWLNPNKRASEAAAKFGKAFVALSDTHRLEWMRDHYFLLDAKPTQSEVFAAIRAGRYQNVSRPLTLSETATRLFWMFSWHDPMRMLRKAGLISAPRSENRRVVVHSNH